MTIINILLIQLNLLNSKINKGDKSLIAERDKLLAFIQSHGYCLPK